MDERFEGGYDRGYGSGDGYGERTGGSGPTPEREERQEPTDKETRTREAREGSPSAEPDGEAGG